MNYNWGALSRAKTPESGALEARPGLCAVMRADALPECGDDVAELLQALAEEIRLDEPGCVSYAITRALGSETHFAVHARFSDWRAFQRHGVTRHMKRAMPALKACLASAVTLEIFLEI